MKKKIAVLIGAALAAVTLAGCGASAAPANPAGAGSSGAVSQGAYATTLQDIKDKGELVIGLDDTFAPMGFRDAGGNLVGFDIDLAAAVCEKLGVTATFQPIDWNAKEMELSTGNIDCIWNGMSATPERQEAMSLSNPYLNNKMVVMTNTGITIANKQDLANYTIGVQAGSGALAALQADEIYDSIKDKLTEYPTYDEVIMDMNAGRLDCMVIDQVFGDYKNAKMDNKFGTADFDFGDDLYAIGFRKSDTELTEAVNQAILDLIADGKAGEISTEWFGTDIVLGK